MRKLSLVKRAPYASVLRSSTMLPIEGSSTAKRKGKALIGGKRCQVSSGTGAFVGCLRVGEMEGVLWAVRAQLPRVMEKVKDLMTKVDKGLD